MDLVHYSKLIAPLMPVKAGWVSIDEECIRVFTERPTLEGVAERHLRWRGKCIAMMRYWKGFLDISDLVDVDGTIDWLLGAEKTDIFGWKDPLTLEQWIDLLDAVMPMEFEYATLDNSHMRLWKRRPVWNEGKWYDRGLQKPVASFFAPPALVATEDGAITGPDAIVRL